MKKNNILMTLALLLLGTSMLSAQVSFREGSLDECAAEAKKTGKKLFVVASATWCGPCKKMQQTVLDDPKVGEFINKYYVAKKYYLDKGDPDNIADNYKIKSYPTVLFLDTDKKVLQSMKGASTDPEYFINRVQQLLDPNNSNEKWEQVIREHPEKTIDYANHLIFVMYNLSKADSLVFDALKKLPPSITFSPDWILYYRKTIISPLNPVMKYIYDHEKEVEKVMGKEGMAEFMRKKGIAFISRNTNNRFYTREKFNAMVAEVEKHPMLLSDFLTFAKANIDIIEKGDFEAIKKVGIEAIKKTNDKYSKNEILSTICMVGVWKNGLKKSSPEIISVIDTIIKNEKNGEIKDSFIKIREDFLKAK